MNGGCDKFNETELKNAAELFRKKISFMLSVADLSQLPTDKLAEIAFAGRSNVGKSSIINALFNQKKLAKASNTPGRTQQLNFFNLDDRLHIVDLPGYGYAEAPEKLVRQWQKLIFDYLRGRVNLKRVFLLVDSRRGLKKSDLEIMEMLDKAAVTYQIIMTKADKTSSKEQEQQKKKLEEEIKKHAAAYTDIIITSSVKGSGIDILRAEIAALI